MPAVSRPIRLLLAPALLAIIAALWILRRTEVPPLSPELAGEVPSRSAAADTLPSAPLVHGPQSRKITPTEQWREPEWRSGVDASNIYKNAFVRFNALTEAEKKMLRNPKDEVDADAAAALFEKIQPILAMLREAMKADYCDWGVAPISVDTPLTYIVKAQDLGKLALWSAAYRMSSDPGKAIEDLQTRARLGHHLSDVLIGGLVSASFETGAQELLRNHLPALDPAAQAAAAAFLDGSTLDADLSRGFASEASMVQNMADEFPRKSQAEREEVVAILNSGANSDVDRVKQEEVLALFESPERLAAEVAFIRATEERVAASLALPEAEFQAWWKATEAEIARGHPLAREFIPTIAAVQARAQQRRVERTLFTAGLDMLQNGPAKLARYRDPATGRALTYVPTPTGFDLRSSYGVKGKPVTMSFPAAP